MEPKLFQSFLFIIVTILLKSYMKNTRSFNEWSSIFDLRFGRNFESFIKGIFLISPKFLYQILNLFQRYLF